VLSSKRLYERTGLASEFGVIGLCWVHHWGKRLSPSCGTNTLAHAHHFEYLEDPLLLLLLLSRSSLLLLRGPRERTTCAARRRPSWVSLHSQGPGGPRHPHPHLAHHHPLRGVRTLLLLLLLLRSQRGC
jgi:hypothetical protein